MSKRLEKQLERQLLEIVNLRANENKCGECGSSFPTWASPNLGIVLCGRCASIHRRVLSPLGISQPKSLTLERWSEREVDQLSRIGNRKARKRWNAKHEPFPFDDEDSFLIEEYFRNKYILRKFATDDFERLSATPTGSTSRSSNRSRGDIPRLSHRKMTTYENTLYGPQLTRVMGFGYRSKDSVIEALLLGNGDIELALDILDQDSKQNPSEREVAPALPKRPAAAPRPSSLQPAGFSQASSNGAGQSSASEEWWNAPTAPTMTGQFTQPNQQPQIYQYTDPTTGQVSYVDNFGQEYLDPSNPQHQQLLSSGPLDPQQTARQNILSYYNQPNAFTTNQVLLDQSNGIQQTQSGIQQNQSGLIQNQTGIPQNQNGMHQNQYAGVSQNQYTGMPQGQHIGFSQNQYVGVPQKQYTGIQQNQYTGLPQSR